LQIPDKFLEDRPRHKKQIAETEPSASTPTSSSPYASSFKIDDDDGEDRLCNESTEQDKMEQHRRRRLSTFENAEEVLADLEDFRTENTARRL